MSQATEISPAPGAGMFATDFDALAVGDVYTSVSTPIEMKDVEVFAALTGDHHPIHVDAEWAATGPFGKPIAHGLLVLSLAVGVLPLDPARVIALRRLREVTFKRPVSVGESAVVRCTVAELRPLDADTGLVVCEWRILGPDERLRARALVEILWRRSEIDAGAAEQLDPVRVDEDGSVQVLV